MNAQQYIDASLPTNKEVKELHNCLQALSEEYKSLADGSNEEYDIFAHTKIEQLAQLNKILTFYVTNKPSDKLIEESRLQYTE